MDVKIYRGQDLIGSSVARYLSLWSVVLAEGPVRFPPQTRLHLEISLSEGEADWRCRVPAIVSGVSRMGVGLTFEQPDQTLRATLREIIFRSWKQLRYAGAVNPALGPSAIAWPAAGAPVE